MAQLPSPIVEALLKTNLIPLPVVRQMVAEGRLDQEAADRLYGLAADLTEEQVAAMLETALREDLQVVIFDPIDDGFRVEADWGTGITEGRLLGASTLYMRIDDPDVDASDIWNIWDGEVWVAMPYVEGAVWLLRDPSIVHYNNQRWIKATTR